MLSVWIYTIASVLVVSAISLIGILVLSLNLKKLRGILLLMVGFSAGALVGDAFFHLLPEATAKNGFTLKISLFVLAGIVLLFIIEKIVQWHHCHEPECDINYKPIAIMNLIGDFMHNIIDGLIIGASYLVSIPLGIVTTIAVILHEIPQEIGDYGVLLHGGFSKRSALFVNFLSALGSIVGAVIVLFVGSQMEGVTAALIPFAAGTFIYIAGSDLIPELHRSFSPKDSIKQLFVFVLGIAVMFGLLYLEPDTIFSFANIMS